MGFGMNMGGHELGSLVGKWMRDKWRMFRPGVGKKAEGRLSGWVRKAGESGFVSRFKRVLGIEAETQVKKGVIFSRFLSKQRLEYIGVKFGVKLIGAFAHGFSWITIRLLKAPITIIRVLARSPKNLRFVKTFGSKYPEHSLELAASSKLGFSFGESINPLLKLRSKSSTGWSSRFKWLFSFARDMALWTAFDSLIDAIWNDDPDDEGTKFKPSDAVALSDYARKEHSDSTFSRYINASATFIANAGSRLYEAFSLNAIGDNDDVGLSDVMLNSNLVVNMIASQPRSATLRAHLINLLLYPSDQTSSQWLKELLFSIDEEDAEKVSAAYLGALRLGVDEYQKSVAEDVVDDDGGMPALLLAPTLTTVASTGVWTFDDRFEKDDLAKLSDVDELSSLPFEGDVSRGCFLNDRSFDEFTRRIEMMEIASSVR